MWRHAPHVHEHRCCRLQQAAAGALLVLSASSWAGRGAALDNGLGLTPPMGDSSWNDCGSAVNESWVKRTATYLIESGLAARGWVHVNVDEEWMATAATVALCCKPLLPSYETGPSKSVLVCVCVCVVWSGGGCSAAQAQSE